MITIKDLYAAYPDADILAISPPESTSYEDFIQEAEHAGDTLFLFILSEICNPNDPCDAELAKLRLNSAIADLQAVRDGIN